jgi:hypothetical protein
MSRGEQDPAAAHHCGSLPTIDMLARLAHATGAPQRIAAPGITDVDLGGAA